LFVECAAILERSNSAPDEFFGKVHFSLKLPFPAGEDVFLRELAEVPFFASLFGVCAGELEIATGALRPRA
jgi:hypothetical protein